MNQTVQNLFTLAEQGNADAQLELGGMYFAGNGIPKDESEAVKWTTRAAEQDNTSAQVHLGWMLLKGLGAPRDEEAGVGWIRRAAELGQDRAQFSLGWLYVEGWGVPQEVVEAYKFAHLSAEQGNAQGAELRSFLAQKLSPEQVTEAQRLAGVWKAELEKRRAG